MTPEVARQIKDLVKNHGVAEVLYQVLGQVEAIRDGLDETQPMYMDRWQGMAALGDCVHDAQGKAQDLGL